MAAPALASGPEAEGETSVGGGRGPGSNCIAVSLWTGVQSLWAGLLSFRGVRRGGGGGGGGAGSSDGNEASSSGGGGGGGGLSDGNEASSAGGGGGGGAARGGRGGGGGGAPSPVPCGTAGSETPSGGLGASRAEAGAPLLLPKAEPRLGSAVGGADSDPLEPKPKNDICVWEASTWRARRHG